MKLYTTIFVLSCCIATTLYSSEEWNARLARISDQLETANLYNQAFKAGSRQDTRNQLKGVAVEEKTRQLHSLNNQTAGLKAAGKQFKKATDPLLASQKKQAECCECNCLSSCSFFMAISNCFHGKCNTCWEKCCAHEREEKIINDATIN